MAELVVQELDLDYARFEQGARKVSSIWDELDTRSDRMGKESPFAKQTSDALKFNNQLRSGNELYKRLESAPKQYKAETARLSAELAKLIANQEKAGKAGNWKDNQEQIKRTRAELDALNKKYDETIAKQNKARDSSGRFTSGGSGSSGKSGGFLSSLTGKIPGGIAGVLGGLGIGLGAKEIITGIVSVRAEYQRLEKQLEVTLGSKSAAVAAQELITNFANKTPHEIAGVTSAFNRLVDIGIVPTERQLFALSDIALSKGKTINDYVEAIADAQTGEFERLKEFGIKASKNGDQIAFSFKGQRVEVENTAAAINDYLIGLGNVPGVAGQTEEAGKTLEGRWSTLKDTFAGTANTIGSVLQPAMEKLLDLAQVGADKFKGFFDAVKLVYEQKGLGAAVSLFFDPFGAKATIDDAAASQKEDDYRSGKTKEKDSALDDAREKAAAQARESARQNKAASDAKKAADDAKKAKAKQQQINLDLTREAEKLVEDRKKLQDELAKLEADGEKLRLEMLDKNGKEYLTLKRKLDLQEIETERKKYIELGQQATGTPFYNTKAKRVETRANLAYKLPAATEAIFADKRNAVELEGLRGAQGQYEAQQKADRKAFNDAEDKYDKDRAKAHEKTTRQAADLQFELRKKLFNTEQDIVRKAGESEIDYEKRKAEELLAIKIDYYDRLLKLMKADPNAIKEDIQNLKEALGEARKTLDKTTKQTAEGPKDLFDLLGITFSKDADENDQIKKTISETVSAVIDGAQQILAQNIADDEAEVARIDQRLEAKRSEIQTEATLKAAGLANNLETKRREEQQLQQERVKALNNQKKDQAAQLALNAVLQASELALAIARITANSAKIPVVGLIAAGLQIGALFLLVKSGLARIDALPKYHDGDEVTRETALRRLRPANGPRHDEIDARLQIGEGITRKESYQPNKKLFSRLNALGRGLQSSDLPGLLAGTGIELPESMMQGDLAMIRLLNESRQVGPDHGLHQRVDGLASRLDTLIDETRQQGRKKQELLPDGRHRITDEKGNVTIVRYT